jgi:hypothetical protein
VVKESILYFHQLHQQEVVEVDLEVAVQLDPGGSGGGSAMEWLELVEQEHSSSKSFSRK